MVRCSVLSCRSDSGRKIDGVSFYSFPVSDPTLCTQWVAATNRINWKPTKFSRICSNHFDEKFIIKVMKKTSLLRSAVPNLSSSKTKTQDVSKGREKTPSSDKEDFISNETLWPSNTSKKRSPSIDDQETRSASDAESKDVKMKCCVPFCEETTGTPSGIEDFFVGFPTTKRIRKTWLEAIGLHEEDLPQDAVVCSRHFRKQDLTGTRRERLSLNNCVPSAVPVQFCLVCLETTGKLHPLNYQLRKAYANLTGLCEFSMVRKVTAEPRACAECSRRLLSAEMLRERSLRAHRMLLLLLDTHDRITLKTIRTVNRDSFRLTSSLVKHTIQPDHYNLYIKDGIVIEKDRCDSQDIHKHVDHLLNSYVQNIENKNNENRHKETTNKTKDYDETDSKIDAMQYEERDPLEIKSEDETDSASDYETEYLDDIEMEDKDDHMEVSNDHVSQDSLRNYVPNDTDENAFDSYVKFVNENIKSVGNFDHKYATANKSNLSERELKNDSDGKNRVSLNNLILVTSHKTKTDREKTENTKLSEEFINRGVEIVKNETKVSLSNVILVRGPTKPMLNEVQRNNIITTEHTTKIDNSENRVKHTNQNINIPMTTRHTMELKYNNKNISSSCNRMQSKHTNTSIIPNTASTNNMEFKQCSVKRIRVIKIPEKNKDSSDAKDTLTTNLSRENVRTMDSDNQTDLMAEINCSTTKQEVSAIGKDLMAQINKSTTEQQLSAIGKQLVLWT